MYFVGADKHLTVGWEYIHESKLVNINECWIKGNCGGVIDENLLTHD